MLQKVKQAIDEIRLIVDISQDIKKIKALKPVLEDYVDTCERSDGRYDNDFSAETREETLRDIICLIEDISDLYDELEESLSRSTIYV